MKNTTGTLSTSKNYLNFVMTGKIAASGNVDSMINDSSLSSYCFVNMFYDCDCLTTAPELPATTLANYCYSNMFGNCKSLKQAPELPATTLANYCYSYMFMGCKQLEKVICYANDVKPTMCVSDWLSGVAQYGSLYTVDTTIWKSGSGGKPTDWKFNTATVDLNGGTTSATDWNPIPDTTKYVKEYDTMDKKWSDVVSEIGATKTGYTMKSWDPEPAEKMIFEYAELKAEWTIETTQDEEIIDAGDPIKFTIARPLSSGNPNKVTVNGIELNNDEFTISPDGDKTIITLTPEFTKSLSGTCEFMAYYGEDVAYAEFTVNDSPTPVPPGPTPTPTPTPEPTPVPTPFGDVGTENIVFIAGVSMTVLVLFAVAFIISRMKK